RGARPRRARDRVDGNAVGRARDARVRALGRAERGRARGSHGPGSRSNRGRAPEHGRAWPRVDGRGILVASARRPHGRSVRSARRGPRPGAVLRERAVLGSADVKQVVQDRKSGAIEVLDLSPPALTPRSILVRNAFSVVSPGTERNSVLASRDSYLKTARARPDLVRRVLDTVKREGVMAAYRKVEAKLSGPHPLGYSSAGVVIAVGSGAGHHFRVGDRVACCGQGVASHAEIVCVPVNLAALVPDGVPLEDAAFSTLGAIALHGVRTMEPQ